MLLRIGMLIAVAIISSGATYVALVSTQDLNATQEIVMHEYLSTSCKKDNQRPVQYLVGQAAVLSRVIVKANLGTIALAEYAKCKVGL